MEPAVGRQASGLPHSLSEKPSALADGVFTGLSQRRASAAESVNAPAHAVQITFGRPAVFMCPRMIRTASTELLEYAVHTRPVASPHLIAARRDQHFNSAIAL
jgi:hypothetical protein